MPNPFHFFTDFKSVAHCRSVQLFSQLSLQESRVLDFRFAAKFIRKFASYLGALLCALLLASHVNGHHSYKGNYDTEKQVELSGSVVEYKPGYPHTYLILQVTDTAENISFWTIETHSPNLLERVGWDAETFAPGDLVEVTGTPSKTTGNYMRLLKVKFPNGESTRVQRH